MNKRIEKLTELTLAGKMYVNPQKTEFNREDLFLTEGQAKVKRLCEYILNQQPKITKFSCFTGFFSFDGSVVGDVFGRSGHKHTAEAMHSFYLKPIKNLSTMEWQHATGDYKKVLEKGISGIIGEINQSLCLHKSPEETEFLNGLKETAKAVIAWSEKCSELVLDFSKNVKEPEYKENLQKLSAALLNVPKNKPSNFYEAVLSIYVCFSLNPDSLGTLDRYLTDFYKKDSASGNITQEKVKEYLQELFLMVQAKTPLSGNFTRGGESHFCVGGYLPNGEDGFNEMSRLIVESLLDLPIYCPEVTLRWTEKTPHEVFKYVMDCERKDKFKRFAFTNDEKRIKCYTEICGFPYEHAVNYTMVGCNEPAFLGAITGSTSKGNLVHCIEALFHEKAGLLNGVKGFDDFYKIFENEMLSDIDKIYYYDNKYNLCRARDVNYISNLIFNDCIENAKSMTQGGGNTVIASPMLLGITNVIDSVSVVKQFVFDTESVTLKELINAVQSNWNGYEALRKTILNTGCFFGNDDDTSNYVAQKIYESFYRHLKGRKNAFGYQWLIGDLLGYNEHHRWFGESTKATPDGRFDGDLIKFGIGQSEGKDREGLTALLNSIAKLDPHGISCGSTVTNISLDEKLVKDDCYFEKTVDMFEAYFKNGGIHFQLTYVSKEELIAAQKDPEQHRNLRVRVTGFSDYFVKLPESIRKNITERTTHSL